MQLATDQRKTVFVARQPILDQSGRVFGYELLYRGSAGETACTTSGDLAGARVLTDAVLALGLDTLTCGLPAFVNLTKRLLVSDAGTLLPASSTVLELREDIAVDDDVVKACKRLHEVGYALALDDYSPHSGAEVLLPYVKFVKVDVLQTPARAREVLARQLQPRGIHLIAEKVETAQVAKDAAAVGYCLFQGYYFCKPVRVRWPREGSPISICSRR